MGGLTFRIDDVSSNTDLVELREMIRLLRNEYIADVLIGITLFSRYSSDGAVYPDAPFKDRDLGFFLNVTQFKHDLVGINGNVASHGLFHADHSMLSEDAQRMSILGSCNYLCTDIFIPPFNRFNETTEKICNEKSIQLMKLTDGWRSLEHNEFDSTHSLWYLHPWKWTVKTLEEKLCQLKR